MLGPLERDRRWNPDHGVEEHRAFGDAGRGQLERQPAAEAVSDHRRALHAGGFERLADVLDVLRERPGRFPARVPVAAQVGGEHPEAPPQPLLGEAAKAAAVGRDAVEAEDRWGVPVAPLVEVQQHAA